MAGAGGGGGTITVSAAQLGQVALQIQQQVWCHQALSVMIIYASYQGGGKIVPQIVQQRLGQQPAQSGQPGTVQVVQQINTSGQVVHQVNLG